MSHNAIYDYRRVSERKPCFLACGFILLNKNLYSAGFEDVSPSGVGMITGHPLPINSQVTLALNTKKRGLILIDGKVCWSKKTHRGWRCGVSFNKKLCFEPSMIA